MTEPMIKLPSVQIRELQQTIAQDKAIIAQAETTIALKEAAIAQKDAYIAELEQKLAAVAMFQQENT